MSSPYASTVAEDGTVIMENDGKYLHGRLDPGNEDSIGLVESIPSDQVKWGGSQSGVDTSMPLTDDKQSTNPKTGSMNLNEVPNDAKSMGGRRLLTDLPTELIGHILSYLGAVDLVAMSATCRLLANHASSDLCWYRHVQENVPGVKVASPAPCASYRELYQAHDPHWFLTKYKVWFSDFFLTGKIIIARYDPRRGCIEGYRLVAERKAPTFIPWEHDDEVIVHSFEPNAHLHLEQPTLQLDALSLESLMASSVKTRSEHRFSAETPMRIHPPSSPPNNRGIFTNFLLTRPVEVRPNMQLWPPPTIPASQRVRNASQESFIGSGHKPQKRSEVSDQAFRIRKWIEMQGQAAPGLHLGEEVITYATLDPKLYTPTEDKPYRGIWMGDYSGHGVEFLLMHQPDDAEEFDESSVVQRPDETLEEFKVRKKEERIYRGRLEAIKLTGDPNVPRGEFTFVSEDLGENGYIRTITENEFKGARVVQSKGHVAARMFRNDKYIESQLILISGNRLAQYWVGFGHISFFERVDIDSFLSPFDAQQSNNACPSTRT